MRILVSSCILGCNCKYNGGNNYNKNAVDFLHEHDVIEICPEMLAGMGSPRACVEIVNGIVMDQNARNVDVEYRYAVKLALLKIKEYDIDFAILQSRSPTCGVNMLYDGSFTGTLKEGRGLFAQALIDNGYKVFDVENFKNEALDLLDGGTIQSPTEE